MEQGIQPYYPVNTDLRKVEVSNKKTLEENRFQSTRNAGGPTPPH